MTDGRIGSSASVSVVIPAYQSSGTLARCLDAVLAQDWPADRMEEVVVDNGSTDNTVEVVKRTPARLVFEPKRGRSAPRNRGVAEASKDAAFIASVDADVEVPPDFLKSLAAALDRPWIGAAQAAVARIRKEGLEKPSAEHKLARSRMAGEGRGEGR